MLEHFLKFDICQIHMTRSYEQVDLSHGHIFLHSVIAYGNEVYIEKTLIPSTVDTFGRVDSKNKNPPLA